MIAATILDIVLWSVFAAAGIILILIGRDTNDHIPAAGGATIIFLVIVRITLIILPYLIYQQPYTYK